MKKSIILFSLVIALLSGCGQSSSNSSDSKISVQNGAFTCTPSDIVNEINSMVEADSDGILLSLGEYKESGESISADELGRLQLTMEENTSGNLKKLNLYWSAKSHNANVVASSGAYCATIFGLLSPENAEATYDSISQIVSAGAGQVEFDHNGVLISFLSSNGLNWLEIEAIDTEATT